MWKIPKREGKRVILGLFQTPGPTRKLRNEATSSFGRARLLQVEATTHLGELLFNLLPSFPINRREGVEGKKEKEKTRLRSFRIASVIDSYTVLRSFFVHRPISFYFEVLNSLYAP